MVEAIAVFFGVVCVWLTIRQNIWCWPTGLVQVVLFAYIFFGAKLYSDMILHVIYIVMQFYGWYYWLHGGKEGVKLSVTYQTSSQNFTWLMVVAFGTAAWGYTMASFTDAAIPYGDAFTTVASLVAQWLMARKVLESWVCWIAVDVVAIGIYFYKALYLTTGLYVVFLIMATMGYFAWKKSEAAEEVSFA